MRPLELLGDGVMRGSVIKVLQNEGQFELRQAVALAQAMEMSMEAAQYVTVPVLDARIAHVDARFAQVDARFAQVDARFDRVDARFAELKADIDSRFVAANAKLVYLVSVLIFVNLANGPIGVSVLDAIKRLL